MWTRKTQAWCYEAYVGWRISLLLLKHVLEEHLKSLVIGGALKKSNNKGICWPLTIILLDGRAANAPKRNIYVAIMQNPSKICWEMSLYDQYGNFVIAKTKWWKYGEALGLY